MVSSTVVPVYSCNKRTYIHEIYLNSFVGNICISVLLHRRYDLLHNAHLNLEGLTELFKVAQVFHSSMHSQSQVELSNIINHVSVCINYDMMERHW